jgi:endonuclease/exonuclease/phosphatase (EEP) superfamily protein YafD
MNRPEPSAGLHAVGGACERAEVAQLAARVTALPARVNAAVGKSSREGRPTETRRLSWWTWLLLAIAWLVTFALGAVVLLRIFFHDGTFLLTGINAFTWYVYLPAYGCLLVALWKRRRWLAAANVGIIGCHLWWLAPDFVPDRRFATTTATVHPGIGAPPSLRIFFANVRTLNQERNAIWQEIEDRDPDIVVLVEAMWGWRDSFRKSSLPAAYPYNSGLDQVTVENFVFSKLPPKSIRDDWIAGRCVQTVEFPLGAETLHLVGLHAPRPMDLRDNIYADFWNRAMPMLLGERQPLVVIGDFNATQYSHVYQELKAAGLRSAHEDRGRGYATTWPNGTVPLPPIRIDQAFLSPDVTCLNISEGRGLGSDHKPLVLDIEIGRR